MHYKETFFSNRVDSILNDEHREHGARRIDDEDLGINLNWKKNKKIIADIPSHFNKTNL